MTKLLTAIAFVAALVAAQLSAAAEDMKAKVKVGAELKEITIKADGSVMDAEGKVVADGEHELEDGSKLMVKDGKKA